MVPIRVHLGPMPAMLRTIVGDLLTEQPDMVVVGQSESDQDALRSACAEGADVLIAEEPEAGTTCCLEALIKGGAMSIFTLSSKGLSPGAVRLVQTAPFDLREGLGLIDAIRASSGPADPEVAPSFHGES